MEPIFFNPIYKNVIWGGNNISKILERDIDGKDIGESWEVSSHRNGLSIIANGEFKGRSLFDLFNDTQQKNKVFGKHCEALEKFPILVKFIDATDNLSIQVHPNNEYALKNENDSGKNEVWYVIDCKENAKIVYGFKENVKTENLKNTINNIQDNVNFADIKKGDFISIPAGTIHAIMGGVVVFEVQQSSDVTYRVYDWDRVDSSGKSRELHINKALDVINLNNKTEIKNYEKIDKDTNIYKSDAFNMDIIKINSERENISNEDTFFVYVVLEGKGQIKSENFSKNIKKGDSFLIPSNLGKYCITGDLKVAKIWV